MIDSGFYHTHGYLHVPAVFSHEEITVLRAEAYHVAKYKGANRPWNGPWKREDEKYTLVVVPGLHRESELWTKAARKPELLDIVSQLVGGPPKLLAAMLVSKPPETGQPFPLHQDGAYYGKAPEYCIVTVYVDDVTPEMGPLHFLPGYHAKGLLPHVNVAGEKAHLPLDDYRMEDTVEVCGKAGDVVCFSLYTPHASTPNRSSKPRTLVRLGYVRQTSVD